MGDSSSSSSRRQGFLPAVRVTDADRREYASIVDESLCETLALYEDFAFRRKRRMDPRRWKLLRAKESTRVYRERSGSDRSVANATANNATSTSTNSSIAESSSVSGSTGSGVDDEPETFTGVDEDVLSSELQQSVEIGPGSSLSVSTKIPVLVTTSQVPGELEDVMYGTFASDAAGILRRSLYEKDGMNDAVVLATLDAPSEDRPFDSLQVVWMLRAFPGVGAALVRQRDFLLLLSTGTTVSSTTGERIGFGVAQSVVHPDLPELRELQIVRGVMSYCVVYRQLPGQQQVDTFIQVVLDPRGAAMTFFIVQEIVNSLLGVSSPVDCALRKKLTWFVRKARDRRRRDASKSTAKPPGSSSSSSSSSTSPGNSTAAQSAASILADTSAASSSSSPLSNYACVHCAKPLGSLFGSQGQRCSICHHVVSLCLSLALAAYIASDLLLVDVTGQWACNKCRVNKSLAVRAPPESKGAPFVARPFAFCLPCFVAAKNYPAKQLQLEELRLRQRSSHRDRDNAASSSTNPAETAISPAVREDGATLYRLIEQ